MAFLADIQTVWLIGCGAMSGALLARWRAAGLSDDRLVVIDPAPANLPGDYTGRRAGTIADAAEGAPSPDLVILGVKPQLAGEIADALRTAVARPFLLLSILAGVRAATLANLVPDARVVRIMPNMPARVGRGITAVYMISPEVADREVVERLLRPAGEIVWLEDEQRFDVVTALSGSGPAFLFRFVEVLAGAGEAAGLDAQTAAVLAQQTVIGAAALLGDTGESPAALRASVTSPNGTTQAGLDALDGDGALSLLIRQTIRAATERSRAMAASADDAASDAPKLARREPARA